MPLSAGRERLEGGIAFGVPFLAYAFTTAPGLTGEDSGAFLTAAYEFGILHPPGYPLWCLLARAFATLLPFGDFAWRVNLFSGFSSALACALGWRLLRRRGVGSAGAVSGAALAGLADAVWGQSVIAEVYGATLLGVFGALLALDRWREVPTPRRFAAFLFVGGLFLTLQPLARGLLPIFLAYAFLERPALLRDRRSLAVGALALLAGLLPILYLPLRSAADPFLDWGNPETPRALWNHLTMRQYTHGEDLGMDPPTYLGFGPRMGRFGEILLSQFPLPVLGLAGIGTALAARRWGRFGALLLATALATSVGLVYATSLRDAFFFPPAYETYSLPAFALLGLFAGAAVDGLRGWKAGRLLALPLGILAVAWTAADNGPRNDRSEDRFFEPFGRALLENVEPDGVLLAAGDHLVFPCLFLQRVRGVRTDVHLPQRYGYLEETELGALSREERDRRRTLRGAPRLAFDAGLVIRRWIATRPVYAVGIPFDPGACQGLEGSVATSEGMFLRISLPGMLNPAAAREKDRAAWRRLSFPPLEDESRDRSERLAAALVRVTRGLHRIRQGDLDGGRTDLMSLLRNDLTDSLSLVVGARALAAGGAQDEAVTLLREALRRGPDSEGARRFLAELEGRPR
jgi:transmembrane protein TMEM260 (protein O-mannosyltransferase)